MEPKYEICHRCELPKIICQKTICNPTKKWFDQQFQEILLILEVHKILTLKPKIMNEQIPTIGRIVTYTTTERDREVLRVLGCNVSKELPAIIVATWGDQPTSVVNLKVFLDGSAADLWKTSISVSEPNEKGEYPEGQWHWPVKK